MFSLKRKCGRLGFHIKKGVNVMLEKHKNNPQTSIFEKKSGTITQPAKKLNTEFKQVKDLVLKRYEKVFKSLASK